MFADILPHCLSSLLFSQSPTLVMVIGSIWPMGASWRSTWSKMQRSWSSSHLALREAVFCGRKAEWGQNQDGHGEKLRVAFSCVEIYASTPVVLSSTGRPEAEFLAQAVTDAGTLTRYPKPFTNHYMSSHCTNHLLMVGPDSCSL